MLIIGAINTVTNQEYIELLSTLEIMTTEKFQCHTCLNAHCNKKDGERITQTLREVKRCFNVDRSKIAYQFLNIKYYWCLGNYNSIYARELIDLYFSYEKGIMPYSGALSDQPSKIIDVFRIVDYYKSELDRATKKK